MNFLISIVSKVLIFVIALLPTSPFASFIDITTKIPYLDYVNWFLPIAFFISVGEAWLVACGLYYMYSIILRWIKAVE